MSGPVYALWITVMVWNGLAVGALTVRSLGRVPLLLDMPIWLASISCLLVPGVALACGYLSKDRETRGEART